MVFKRRTISCIVFFGGLILGLAPTNYAKNNSVYEDLQKRIANNPQDADSYYNLGVYFYQNGETNNCINTLQKVIDLKPNDEDAHLLLGSVYLQMSKWPESEKYLKKTLEINPKNIDAHNNLSVVYYNLKRNDEAIEQLEKNLQIDPNHLDTLNNLATMYTKLGRVDDAINGYKKLVKLNPKLIQAYNRLAYLYFQQQNYDEVIKLYHQAKGNIPGTSSMFTNLGFAYLYKGDLNEAYKNFNQSKQINPGDPEIHYGLGLIAYKNADLDMAIQTLKQAIKLKPNYQDALYQLAITYEDQGEYIKALIYYQQIIKLSPEDAIAKQNYHALKTKSIDYYLRKGSNAYFDGNYQQAIEDWKNVKKIDSKNVNALKFIQTAELKLAEKVKTHNAMAESYNQKKSPQDAYREWSATLKLDPSNKQALEGLEKTKIHQKDKTDDSRIAQALGQKRPGNGKTDISSIANFYKADVSTKSALPIARAQNNDLKNKTEQLYRNGMKMYSEGKLREAIINLEQALELDPTNQGFKNLLYKARTQLRENIKALMARGIELNNSGRVAEAKEKFAEVLKLNPENQEAEQRLKGGGAGQTAAVNVNVNKETIKKLYYDGVSLYLDGQNRKAIEVWQKILAMDPENQEAKSSIVKAEMELKEMEKRGIQTE